ncbi:MAG: TIGR00366 family protein [Desulfovibrio sp.]|jgi:short-chain fatty acids transporter|nr:TIGR00366 family protein [Desulfovibrio sp.]
MLWSISKRFQFAADKIIPESFVFCIILTLIAFVLGLFVNGFDIVNLVDGWYKGLWDMIAFAFQMSFMVITCGAAAKAPAMSRLLVRVASFPKTPAAAYIVLLLFGIVASFINWAFCTILTPILAMYLSRNVKGLHFPLMIAAGYSMMILGQCWGPSASVYALVATKGHFLENRIGVLSQDVTIYNAVNTIFFFSTFLVILLLAIFTRPPEDELVVYDGDVTSGMETAEEDTELTPAGSMNRSRFLMYAIAAGGIMIIVRSFISKGILGSLNFNFVIFCFMILNCFLYNSPSKFLSAYRNTMRSATDVMIQFPFYGGIMGMMTASGLGKAISDLLVQVGTKDSFYTLSFLSACVLNMFVPSQGGQWVVQGPILVEAAQQLGADIPYVLNAFVAGDECTNLLQPLYLIPALAIVGMKLKDAWGICAFICAFWLLTASVCFYILPMIFPS